MSPAVLAAGTPAWMWYLMRGSGAVSLVLLSASVVLGVSVALRWSGWFGSRLVVEGLHRNLSLMAVAFLSTHVLLAVVDSFISVSVLDVVVPFRAGYQPLWLGLGTLSVDLLAAVVVTSLLRDRVGLHLWRLVHWAAYACWPLAVAHSIGTGTDSTEPWLLGVYGITAVGLLAAVGWRCSVGSRPDTPLGGSGSLHPLPVRRARDFEANDRR